MRSTFIPIAQRKKFDEATIKIWVTKVFAGTLAAADPLVHEQLQIPIPMGGYGAGGVMQKAPAAFISGTVAALPEIHRAAGTTSVDGLRRVHPRLIQQLELATQEVKRGNRVQVSRWMDGGQADDAEREAKKMDTKDDRAAKSKAPHHSDQAT